MSGIGNTIKEETAGDRNEGVTGRKWGAAEIRGRMAQLRHRCDWDEDWPTTTKHDVAAYESLLRGSYADPTNPIKEEHSGDANLEAKSFKKFEDTKVFKEEFYDSKEKEKFDNHISATEGNSEPIDPSAERSPPDGSTTGGCSGNPRVAEGSRRVYSAAQVSKRKSRPGPKERKRLALLGGPGMSAAIFCTALMSVGCIGVVEATEEKFVETETNDLADRAITSTSQIRYAPMVVPATSVVVKPEGRSEGFLEWRVGLAGREPRPIDLNKFILVAPSIHKKYVSLCFELFVDDVLLDCLPHPWFFKSRC